MATWEDIEERQISGVGSIRFPSGEGNQFRAYRLYLQVIRPPQNRYVNLKYPQPKEYFGKALFYKDLYVCDEREINYTAEKWEYVPDFSSQNLIAIKCAYQGLLQSFVNFAIAAGYTYISVTDLIKDYTYLEPSFDRIVFKLYNNTALKLLLQGLKHDTCDPTNDKQQPPNDPPPPDRNPPPNDSPVDVSPPYDGDDDNDFYQPYTGDNEVTPPTLPGNNCQAYRVVINIFSDNFGDPTPGIFTATREVYGEVFIELRGGTPPNQAWILFTAGYPGECLNTPAEDLLVVSGTEITGFEVVTFEEI